MQEWRNGRRAGLRIQSQKWGGGSTPLSCTKKKEFMMPCDISSVFTFGYRDPSTISIHIDHTIVQPIYDYVIYNQKKTMTTQGFRKGTVSTSYIEKACKQNINNHLKELLFNHCIINYLCSQIYQNHLLMIDDPELLDVSIDPSKYAEFNFNFNPIVAKVPSEWHKLHFKQPTRKGYKDLDKQALAFIDIESKKAKEKASSCIAPNDWIRFSIRIDLQSASSQNSCPLNYYDILWLKIENEPIDQTFSNLFLGKKRNDSFSTTYDFFQQYVCNKLNTKYTFIITIIDILPHAQFSFDLFKHSFFLETKEDIHSKLIEILSTRNDITQRREIVSTIFHTLINHSIIPIAPSLIARKEEAILKNLRENPDYIIFRMQPNFKEMVRSLAETQLKEAIIIDSIAYNENITIDQVDICAYLNLLQRQRTKAFIYHNSPATQMYSQEIPLPEEYLKRFCLREKTLNYIIYELTRR